jgi:hypothetical protein
VGIYRLNVADSGGILFVPARVTLSPDDAEAFRLSGRSIPPPVIANLVLDTGSALSSLAPAVLQQLHSPSCGKTRVQSSVGSQPAFLYRVHLEFLKGTLASLSHVAVAGLEMPTRLRANFQGVLGRDMLSHWETFYSGPRGRLTIRDHKSFWGWLFS